MVNDQVDIFFVAGSFRQSIIGVELVAPKPGGQITVFALSIPGIVIGLKGIDI